MDAPIRPENRNGNAIRNEIDQPAETASQYEIQRRRQEEAFLADPDRDARERARQNAAFDRREDHRYRGMRPLIRQNQPRRDDDEEYQVRPPRARNPFDGAAFGQMYAEAINDFDDGNRDNLSYAGTVDGNQSLLGLDMSKVTDADIKSLDFVRLLKETGYLQDVRDRKFIWTALASRPEAEGEIRSIYKRSKTSGDLTGFVTMAVTAILQSQTRLVSATHTIAGNQALMTAITKLTAIWGWKGFLNRLVPLLGLDIDPHTSEVVEDLPSLLSLLFSHGATISGVTQSLYRMRLTADRIKQQVSNAGLDGYRQYPFHGTWENIGPKDKYNQLRGPSGFGTAPIAKDVSLNAAARILSSDFAGVGTKQPVLKSLDQFADLVKQVNDIVDTDLFKNKEALLAFKYQTVMGALNDFKRQLNLKKVRKPVDLQIVGNDVNRARLQTLSSMSPEFETLYPIAMRLKTMDKNFKGGKGFGVYLCATEVADGLMRGVGGNVVAYDDCGKFVPWANFGSKRKQAYDISIAPYFGYVDTMYSILKVPSPSGQTLGFPVDISRVPRYQFDGQAINPFNLGQENQAPIRQYLGDLPDELLPLELENATDQVVFRATADISDFSKFSINLMGKDNNKNFLVGLEEFRSSFMSGIVSFLGFNIPLTRDEDVSSATLVDVFWDNDYQNYFQNYPGYLEHEGKYFVLSLTGADSYGVRSIPPDELNNWIENQQNGVVTSLMAAIYNRQTRLHLIVTGAIRLLAQLQSILAKEMPGRIGLQSKVSRLHDILSGVDVTVSTCLTSQTSLRRLQEFSLQAGGPEPEWLAVVNDLLADINAGVGLRGENGAQFQSVFKMPRERSFRLTGPGLSGENLVNSQADLKLWLESRAKLVYQDLRAKDTYRHDLLFALPAGCVEPNKTATIRCWVEGFTEHEDWISYIQVMSWIRNHNYANKMEKSKINKTRVSSYLKRDVKDVKKLIYTFGGEPNEYMNRK